jgi:5-dehydro-2-deoxygluconokinase
LSPEGKYLDLICMGRTSVDLYGEQEDALLEDTSSFRKYVGGSATNVAVGTAKLGVKSAMLTRVGDEQMGRFIRRGLEETGVDVSHVVSDPERLTPYVLLAVRRIDDFPRLFVYEDSADMAVSEEDVDPGFIASSGALLITGSHLAKPVTREASFKAVRAARQGDTRVVFDLDYRPVFWGVAGHEMGGEMFVESREVSDVYRSALPDCDLIVGTEEEVLIAGGSTDTREALLNIREATDATVVLKTGAMGATVFEAEIPTDLDDGLRVLGFPVEVFNTVGAGDAFLSGFLNGWLYGEPYDRCLTLGNACGAIVVSRHGCSPAMPTSEELEYYLPRANELRRPAEDGWLEHLHRATTRNAPEELHVLAIDHRWQLEGMIEETGGTREDLPRLKQLLGRAFLRVADGDPRSGVLLDHVYGDKALAELTGSGAWISRAIEVTGSRPMQLDGGPNVSATLRSWPAEHVVKCNLYCHPDDEPEVREAQEERVSLLAEACAQEDRQLLLELQPPKGQSYGEGDMALILERFYELGIRPDWWKLPPDPDPAVWKSLGDVVRERDPYCAGVLVLGQAASNEDLAESFAATADEPVCNGFAVGRSIYAEPARQWLAGETRDEQLMSAVAENYEQMISLWQQRSGAGSRLKE